MTKRTSHAFLLLFVLTGPLLFSISVSRLYSRDIFLFFTAPSGDDEGYFDHLNVWFGDHRYSAVPTPDCTVPHNWRGIGSAVLWAPTYLLFKWTKPVLEPFLGMQEMSDAQWLRLGAATGNFFIASAILALAWAVLRFFVSPSTALLFSIMTVFGGMLPYYLFRRPLMSHAAEAFYFLLAIYGVEKMTSDPERTSNYSCVGLACAGVLSTRFQQAPTIGLLLLILCWDHRKRRKNMAFLISSFIIGFMPQLVINRLNFGAYVSDPSQALSFLTPTFLIQLGRVQLIRILDLFIGRDWGLFLMFPWLLFGFFMAREERHRLWPSSRAWILSIFPALLLQANWMAHGGAYAQRYVSLLMMVLSLVAAVGFESLRKKVRRLRVPLYGLLALTFFISLLHFTSFESDESRFTLHFGPATEESPVRSEWLKELPNDYVNGHFSENVYRLLPHPDDLVKRFGAAPLPLFVAVETAHLRHKQVNPAIARYIDKHHIGFKSYWRYMAMLLAVNAVLFLLLFYRASLLGE